MIARMVKEEETFYSLDSLPAYLHGSRSAHEKPGTKNVTNITKDGSADCFETVKYLKSISDSLPSADWGKSDKTKDERKKKSDIHETAKDVETDNKYLYDEEKSEIRQKFDNEKVKKDNLETEKECSHQKLKTGTENLTDFNIFLEESGLDVNEFDADDDPTDNKYSKKGKRESKWEKSLADKEPGHQVLTDKNYGLDKEGEERLVVDIAVDDNRYTEEREKESKEQTHVKTLDLLSLDANRTAKEEKCKERMEKRDSEIEKSTAKYSELKCRGSLQNQVEENCESYMTTGLEEREGEEHSYYSDDSHNQESLPLSWERTKEQADDRDIQELAKIQDELESDCSETNGADIECQSPRLDVSQEEDQAVAITTDGEELSVKEKISLTNDDEKDDCDADGRGAEEFEEDTDKHAEETGMVENRVNPKNGERIVAEFDTDIKEGRMSVAFEQDFTEIKDLAMAEHLTNPFTYLLWVVMDTFLLCITMESKQQTVMETEQEKKGMMGAVHVFSSMKEKSSKSMRQKLFADRFFQEPSLKKRKPSRLLEPNPVCKFKKRKSRKVLEYPDRSDGGQKRSRSKFYRPERNKNAHVKWSKKDKMIDAPDKWDGCSRRLPWLQGDGCGRRCSDRHSGGAQGGGYNGNTGSREKGSGNGGQTGRRNDNDNGSDKNNNDNNNNRGRDSGDYGGNGSGDGDRRPKKRSATQSNPEEDDSNVPGQDFKRYKKKHCQIGFDDLMSFIGGLGAIIEERKGPIWELGDNPIGDCISCSMERPDELSEERICCDVCNVLNSMLKHFADCQELYLACTVCMQVFSFICIHAYDCKRNQYECEIKLCKKFHQVLGTDTIPNRMKCLWFNIKKKLARVLGSDDGVMTSTSSVPVNPPNLTSLGGTRGFNPSLESISESGSDGSTSRSGSRVLARKRSAKLPSLPESESLPFPVGEVPVEVDRAETAVEPQIRESDVLMRRIPPVRKITPSRYTSLPVTGGVEGLHGQYPSFTDKPVGTPGICEVMYGNIRQLVVVSKNWKDLKAMHQRDEPLPRPYREEGIILRQYQEYLVIDEIRYQLEFQWLKVSHLGNGMSGKCHLATDFQTEFKFCVKEIHIGKFEVEEIELWSHLDHPHIVKLYGAIRHGEMIYIFSEFIDGGNLTEAINTQRALNKRLSHRTALILFKQLLQVLIYLKEKNILHEDLKADNILLQREKDSVSIKVTDFGLATRINMPMRYGTKPVGTMTQWSPEKAECVRYGYPAEVWAAVCVLVHMVSGLPPWMRRYPEHKSLIVVIVEQSPPVEDIPRNIPKVVRDLILRGFTVCQGQRPTPEDLLKHEAFKLITGPPQRNDAYSILDSTFHINTTELEEKNSDLQEIIRHLEINRPHAGGSITGDINRIASGAQKISLAENLNRPRVPSQVQNDVTVGKVVLWPEGQGQFPGSSATGIGGSQGNSNGTEIQRSSETSGETSDENPLHHYMNFIRDDVLNRPAMHPENAVVPYHPSMEHENAETLFRDPLYQELENHALSAQLPNFDIILGSSSDPIANDDDDVSGEDEPEAPFDFNKQIEEVKKKYLTPTEEKERNPLIPTLPLVIESLFTTSLETRPTNSLTDSVTSTEGTNVSGTVSTEKHAEFDESRGRGNVSDAGITELVEDQHLGEGLDTEQSEASDANTVEMIPATQGDRFPSGDELFKSGDELFKSGPGELELVMAMDRMSVTANTSVPATETNVLEKNVLTPSLNSPGVGGDEDLFGPFSLKLDDSNKLDVQQPLFPPMCSPSRNAQVNVRQVTGEVTYQHQSLFPGTSELKSTWSSSNTNNNSKQFGALMQPLSLSHTRFTIQGVSHDSRGQYNTGLQISSTTMQTNYQPNTEYASPRQNLPTTNPPYQLPYSFAGQPSRNPPMNPYSLPVSQSSSSLPKRTTSNPDEDHKTPINFPKSNATPTNEPDIRISKNPGPENPRSKFIVGSESSTSSSGEFNSSPIFPPLDHSSLGVRDTSIGSSVTPTQLRNTEAPQLSTVGLQSTVMPQAAMKTEASITLYNRNNSSTNPGHASYTTSTPLKMQGKRKEEKDAMNEMLKSYQSTHGPIEEGQMAELTPPQQFTPSTSPRLPRQRLHLDMNPKGSTVGPVHHVQSAPSLERRTSYPSDHHRLNQPQSATPARVVNRWPSSRSGSESTSAKSQYERQAEALEELQRELETSSHHSHSESNLHLSLLERESFEDETEDPLVDQLNIEDAENVPEFIRERYMTHVEEERKVTVLFICPNRNTPIKMKFGSYHRTWREILKDDLCRTTAIHNDFGCNRFCLKCLDGTPLELSQVLGEEDITVAVVQASDDDPWRVEGGQIFF